MESKIKLSTKTIVLSLVILLSVLVNSFTVSAYNPFYEQNDILFYDKDAKQPPECTPGSNFSMTSSTTLPAETISKRLFASCYFCGFCLHLFFRGFADTYFYGFSGVYFFIDFADVYATINWIRSGT